jgi:hypothetical protein
VSRLRAAPEASRAWLLIEHPGPWPHEAAEAVQPAPLTALVESAEEFGLRVQMIRRPGRRQVGDVRSVYRGRAGQSRAVQEAEHARLVRAGALPLALSAANLHDREGYLVWAD